jgi:hypothetical protein
MKVSTDDGDIYVMKEKELIVLIDEEMKKLNDVIKKLKSDKGVEESPAFKPIPDSFKKVVRPTDLIMYGKKQNYTLVEHYAKKSAFLLPSNYSVSVSSSSTQNTKSTKGSRNPLLPVPKLTYLLYTESIDKSTWSLLDPPSAVWPRECWWICGVLDKMVELESMYTQADRITDALYSYANYLLAIRVPEYNPAVSFSYTYGYTGHYECIGALPVPDVAEYLAGQKQGAADGAFHPLNSI